MEHAEIQVLEARVVGIEGELQRLRDEVEACSVLVLSLDSSVGVGPKLRALERGGGETSQQLAEVDPQVNHLTGRLKVLEEAWSLRRERIAVETKVELERFEREILELWRALRRQEDVHLPQLRSQCEALARSVQDLQDSVPNGTEALKPSSPSDFASIDQLMESFAHDVGQATAELDQRCQRLEECVAELAADKGLADTDRQKAQELQQMIEILVQQRREDISATNFQLKEVAARFTEIDQRENRNNSWRLEADQLHKELEALQVDKLPGLAAQSSRATRLLSDGLQALREDLLRLGERVEAFPKGASSLHQVGSSELGQELVEVKAQVDELRHQLVRTLAGGIEDRFLEMRSQLASEVEAVQRRCKAQWVEASRRLAALEPWQSEAASLHAEVQALRSERQEDRVRWGLALQDELLALRAGMTQGIEQRFSKLDQTLATREEMTDRIEARIAALTSDVVSAKANAPNPRLTLPQAAGANPVVQAGIRDTPAPRALPRSRSPELRYNTTSPGLPPPLSGAPTPPARPSALSQPQQVIVVQGRRMEWSISAASLKAAGQGSGQLVSDEVEVAGCLCTLKFFPTGSPLCKGPKGTCSLYLSISNQKVVRFQVFAGHIVSPLLECTYDRRRDQGRHDLCLLEEALDAEGGILVGAELREVSEYGTQVADLEAEGEGAGDR